MDETAADELRTRIRRDLVAAMKARRTDEVAALRTVMAAVDNAEAIEASATADVVPSSRHIVGAVPGAGSAEATRRELSGSDVQEILNVEAAGLRAEASGHETLGRSEDACRLRAQAEVIRRYQIDAEPDERR
jgi:uncharacterized protein YqeY